MENKEKIITATLMLKDHGATHILVTFSGSGDSGQFDMVVPLPSALVNELDLVHDQYTSDFEQLTRPMADLIEDDELFHDLVESLTKEYNWWDNDGGDGHIIIDLNTFAYKTHYNIFRTESDKYDEEGTITFD